MNSERNFRWSRPARAFSFSFLTVFFFANLFAYADTIYVSSGGDGTVTKFDPSGHGSTFASVVFNAMGVAFDSSGNLYVADFGNNAIEKFTPNGNGSFFASGGLLNGPE